jgi:hypothetical protein
MSTFPLLYNNFLFTSSVAFYIEVGESLLTEKCAVSCKFYLSMTFASRKCHATSSQRGRQFVGDHEKQRISRVVLKPESGANK